MFKISWRRGSLVLKGNTVSDQHEEALRRAAATHFPEAVLHTEFRPLGVAPDWWGQASTELLSALSAIRSPTAILKPDHLQVNGLVGNESVAELHLQTLRKSLPESVALDIRLEPFLADSTPRMICARHFAVSETGPVEFEESGTELRSSAYRVLDRVVTLADACRDATVTITGHTDSSGDETWNQQLSLKRAEAVARYLGTKGIEPERIIVTGAGSSLPIADNATRYGRGLNRRIDVHMTPGRPD